MAGSSTEKEYSTYKSVEVAEPITVEQQYHSGGDFTPEYVSVRFKETDATSTQSSSSQ